MLERRLLSLLAVAVVFAGLSAGPARAEAPAQDKAETAWMVIEVDGQRVGTVREERGSRIEGGREILFTRISSTMAMERFGATVRIEMETDMLETADFKPTAFQSSLKLSDTAMTSRATIKDGVLTLVQGAAGRTSSRDIPFPPDVLFPHGVTHLFRTADLKPGAEVRYKTFLPEQNVVTDVTAVAGAPEEVDLKVGKARLLPVRSTQSVLPGSDIVEWMDDARETIKMETSMMGLTIMSYKVSREEAERPAPAAAGLMADMLVKADRSIARPRDAERARLRLTMIKPFPGRLQIPEDDRQTIAARERDGVVLDIGPDPLPGRAIRFDDLKGPAAPVESLKPNAFIQSDDAEIKRLAAEACKDAGGPVECARRLNDWVFQNMDKKGFDVVLATASETARTRKGDCSEHSVLLAALARSQGIPARVSFGLVNVGPVFAYHMWDEVWLGRWTALDPALGQTRVDATHIRLASSNLDDGLNDLLMPLIPVLNNIAIGVESYTTAGVPVTKDQDLGAFSSISGEQFQNFLLGIAFTAPHGHRFTLPDDDRTHSGTILAEVLTPKGNDVRIRVDIDSVPYDFVIPGPAHQPAANSVEMPRLAKAGVRPAVMIRNKDGIGGQFVFQIRGTLYRVVYADQAAEPLARRLVQSFELRPRSGSASKKRGQP